MHTAAVIVFTGWCCLLSAIDLRERRLPNRLTIPGALAVLGYAAGTGAGGRALVGALALALPYLLVHLALPAAFGAGDVKLSLGLGAAAALGGSRTWTHAALLAPAATALVGLILLVRRRSPPRAAIAHGPSMCAATLFALVVGG